VGKLFYQLFIRLYPITINLASPFNHKAKLWIKGRKGIFDKMKETVTGQPLIWMHCASLGEFEQGRPLLEKIRREYPGHKILLTFFSPSGYEVRKNYTGADYIFYLPMDNMQNAVRFYEIAQPKLVLFIKYEFWNYYLQEAKKRNVPLLLVSAIFRKSQPFFKWHGHFYRKMLQCFTHIFVQNKESLRLLQSVGFTVNISLAGDTRFDRVIEIAEGFHPIPSVESFCFGSDVIVAGSTWTEDDKELAHYANSRDNIKFIIAPHNIGKDRLAECRRLYKHSILFSGLTTPNLAAGCNTIIIDNIGMLSSLYKYATVTYVGGGFGADGVHNVLEAAVFGKPVVFGPEYSKFIEAVELVENGGAITIENAQELEAKFDTLLKKGADYTKSCNAALSYVYSNKGSTEKILKFIYENRLLTN
jgi:3-deoxy-D-manno-octulosonic-acid transferase